jgi:hypothetical protein
MTALTLHGTATASTTLTTADQFSTTSGSGTAQVTNAPASGSNYMELLSQGGTGTLYSSLPSPTGKGWLLDSTLLEGQVLTAGSWSASVQLADTAMPTGVSAAAAAIVIRFYKRSSSGTYTSVGSLTLSNPTIYPTQTTYSLSGSLSSMTFATGDKLYGDLFLNGGTNWWSSDTISVNVANLSITTPGYTPPTTNVTATITETNAVTETLALASRISVTETNNITESVTTTSTPVTPVAVPGSPGGVRLLINDVWYPTIRQETIQIQSSANDPISTFQFRLQDDPSHISISELEEIVILDSSQIAHPTHNLIINPLISPYASNYSSITATGGSFTNLSPGIQLTASNAANSFGLYQNTQPGLVVPGQSYMVSVYAQTSTLTALSAYMTLSFLSASGAVLNTQTLVIGSSVTNTRYSVSGMAPANATTIHAEFGLQTSNATNSGTATFTSLQVEPMSFTSGAVQESYPTPFCAIGQTNCTVMPDGTTVRQYRLFGGYVTKATAGNYVGNNRQWTVQASGYAWLFQKQQLNNTWTNTTDKTIINNIVSQYFPKVFSTAQVVQGATLDTFGYQYNGTARDAFDALSQNSNNTYFIDNYRTIWYQPAGYSQANFMLSDSPDNITSFPYYAYSLDLDATQIGNATIVTGATNISAIEYDAQSIAYYNQKLNGQGTFWRTVNDSTITTTNAARQRAIAENATYNYAQQIAHLSTQQMMAPGQTVLFTSRTDGLYEVPYMVQKATLVLQGFKGIYEPVYEFQCDLGIWQPNMSNIFAKMLRKQQSTTNSIGTPVYGLMVTESATYTDEVQITVVHGSSAVYGMGIYGSSVYAVSIPGVPPTMYNVGVYGDITHGYN